MAFTGNEDHTISLEEGADLTSNFRDNYPGQPQGIYFSKSTLEDVLAQSDCVGIRFYFGLTTNDKLRIVFTGVKASEDDIIGIVGDGGSLCPPACGKKNDLNS